MIRNSLRIFATVTAMTLILAGCGGQGGGSAAENAPFDKFYKGKPDQLTWHVTDAEPAHGPNGDFFERGDAFKLKKTGPNMKFIPIGNFLSRRQGKGYAKPGALPAKMITTGAGAEIVCIEKMEFTDGTTIHDDHYIGMQIDPADPEHLIIKSDKNDCVSMFDHPGGAHARY